jgi:hypothetical protein
MASIIGQVKKNTSLNRFITNVRKRVTNILHIFSTSVETPSYPLESFASGNILYFVVGDEVKFCFTGW